MQNLTPPTHQTVYLDHAATTPLDPEVQAVIERTLADVYANPGALYTAGRHAAACLGMARATVAEVLGVHVDEVVFTGSGTESVNLAIIGGARARKEEGRHIIMSAIEHKAALASGAQLAQEGFDVTRVPVAQDGSVSVDAVRDALRSDTVLVSIMYANNEIGTIQPIADIAAMVRGAQCGTRPPLVHTDACQACGALPIAPHTLGVDLLSLNGSKIYGPKGSGLLYVRAGVHIEPLIVGGDQERGLRAGTENVALCAGLAHALRASEEARVHEQARLRSLQEYFFDSLARCYPRMRINGSRTNRLPNNVHITIPSLEGESLVLMLDQAGVAAATGSACSAHDLAPSHVLRAIGLPDEIIHGSLRFTMGRATTKADIDYAVSALKDTIAKLERITAYSFLAQRAHASNASHTSV